jgi:purine-binding chemotaxis protein CheW
MHRVTTELFLSAASSGIIPGTLIEVALLATKRRFALEACMEQNTTAQRRSSDQIIAAASEIDHSTAEYVIASYLLLRLSAEHYILDSTCVREVARWRAPTPVPGAPQAVAGIINQRGEVLPVINLSVLLGLHETPAGRSTRYLVAHHDDTSLALLVDSVVDLVMISTANHEPLPATLPPQQARLLQAVTRIEGKPASLLDLGEIVAAVRAGA